MTDQATKAGNGQGGAPVPAPRTGQDVFVEWRQLWRLQKADLAEMERLHALIEAGPAALWRYYRKGRPRRGKPSGMQAGTLKKIAQRDIAGIDQRMEMRAPLIQHAEDTIRGAVAFLVGEDGPEVLVKLREQGFPERLMPKEGEAG